MGAEFCLKNHVIDTRYRHFTFKVISGNFISDFGFSTGPPALINADSNDANDRENKTDGTLRSECKINSGCSIKSGNVRQFSK